MGGGGQRGENWDNCNRITKNDFKKVELCEIRKDHKDTQTTVWWWNEESRGEVGMRAGRRGGKGGKWGYL